MEELNSKQRAFVLYTAKVLKCNDGEKLNEKIQSLSQDELNQLATSFNEIYNQQMENNGILMAKLGAKLNYIMKLNGKCPEGYEVQKFEVGGKVCTKCMKSTAGAIPVAAHKNGSKVVEEVKKEVAMKCGGKAKKKKKMECGGKTEKACSGIKMACNGSKMKSACSGSKMPMDKCGSKLKPKKKACGGLKFQNGGETKNNYDESEHSKLIKDYQSGKIKQGSKEHQRLQELNRNQPNHDPAWKPTSKDTKKAAENIKKHLLGGIL